MTGRRIAVVGASGNVGTALLRALHTDPEVDHVLGVSRRRPSGSPYDEAEWLTCDVAEPDGREAVRALTQAFAGYDTVVHLVWAIQPNTRRDVVRRTNVEGTRRVTGAAVAAGVPQVVVASSVAAYSPSPGPTPRTETFATAGVRTSHYSVDKAAQERLLDELAAAHPDVAVARMRTSLVFQRDAGAEIARLFVGPVAPLRALLSRPLPVLPLPRGLRLQATHADDVAAAYAVVVRHRASGAFNVAADPVLTGHDLADLLGSGRLVELAPALVRAAVDLGWRTRAVAADPGWLDMAMNAPILDTTRIRSLGWSPQRTAGEAMLDVVAGMRERTGTGSPALRPDDRTLDRDDLRRRD
ncbi:epimerase [Serinibacter arcticus]|uniref:Epimerase n=1 Tax=Serinibacter arcticus TaxID=1655435 RepID=A0A2U1ZS02_9MICO|nr:NAD-dependent epimerase/dehydratase family protein [Serinibacter arcticus]PWD49702.1 epimerase [Serinibacter arcticus]